MAIFRLSHDTREGMTRSLLDALDAGDGPAAIEIRSGRIPNGTGDVETGEMLAVLRCSSPCGVIEDGGTLVFNKITEDRSASATGQATWARCRDGSGRAIFDCDVGGLHSSATLLLNTTSIVEGGPVRIDAFEIALG